MGMIDLGKLGFDLVLNKNGWNKDFESADNDIEKHESKWKGFAGNMGGALKLGIVGAVVGITGAITGMAIAGGKSAIELQDHMAKFSASTGIVGENADKVKKTVQDLYKVNEDSYEDIVKTTEAMNKQLGMNAESIKKYAQNYMDYAKTTGQNNADAVKSIGDIKKAWGLADAELPAIMDKLKYSNEKYGLSVTDAQNSLKSLAPALKSVNLNVDDAIGYLNMFQTAGVDSSTATTAFTKALTKVKSPEELDNMIKKISETKDGFERTQLATELFGAKAGAQMAQALADGTLSLEDYKKAMEGADGAVTNASANYDKSFKVQLELMKKQFSGLFEELAERLMPIINDLLKWVVANMPKIQEVLSTVFNTVGDVLGIFINLIGDVVDAFKNWYANNEETINKFKDMFEEFKTWFNNIFNEIAEIVKTAWEIIKTLWDTYGNDIMSIAEKYFSYIGTVIETAMTLIKDIINIALALIKGDWEGVWNGIKQFIEDLWEGVKVIFSKALDIIKDLIKLAFTFIKDFITDIWNGISSFWEKTLGDNASLFKVALNNIKDIVSTVFELIKIGIELVWNQIKLYFENVWNLIKVIFDNALKIIKDVFNIFKALFKGDWEGLWNGIKQLFSDTWNGIKEILSTMLKGLIDIFTGTVTNFYNSGKAIFQAVWDGMKDIWNNLSDWVSSKVSWLVDKLSFWKSSKNEMSSDDGGNTKVDGSHFNGLSYVPFDGYTARLHEGERVLTKQENNSYKSTNSGFTQNLNIYSPTALSPSETARQNKRALQELGLQF